MQKKVSLNLFLTSKSAVRDISQSGGTGWNKRKPGGLQKEPAMHLICRMTVSFALAGRDLFLSGAGARAGTGMMGGTPYDDDGEIRQSRYRCVSSDEARYWFMHTLKNQENNECQYWYI